jgi:hypothetical protein
MAKMYQKPAFQTVDCVGAYESLIHWMCNDDRERDDCNRDGGGVTSARRAEKDEANWIEKTLHEVFTLDLLFKSIEDGKEAISPFLSD